jgi:hypothetical protein
LARKVAKHAPYPVSIYRGLLSQSRENPKIHFVRFLDQSGEVWGQINMFVRHDIDTAACIHNMPILLNVDREFGVRAGIYLRADDQEYSLSECRDVLEPYRAVGFEVGLHTVCYTNEDYMGAFMYETDKFVRQMGFKPDSFTVHGLGGYRADARLEFCKNIAGCLQEFGYEFSDCHCSLRSYEYVIEDCHWDDQTSMRFIYDDFWNLPSFFREGHSYLVLTHPCYWKESD